MTDKHSVQRTVAYEESVFQTTDDGLTIELHQQSVQESATNVSGDVADIPGDFAGIADESVISDFRHLEITPATLMAFSLFPSLHVAWADHRLVPEEKTAILQSAEHLGVGSDSPASRLLDSWLAKEPSTELFQAWKDFVHDVGAEMSDAAFQELRSAAMNRARLVAQIAQGLPEFGKTSQPEEDAISGLEAVFASALSQVS